MRPIVFALASTLVLAGTALLLTPTAAADDGACADLCVEDCHVTVHTGQLGAGCTVGHEPRDVWTDCSHLTGCGPWLFTCWVLKDGDPVACYAPSLDPEPWCVQAGYGPDIDYGYCVDPDGEDCRVWKYDRYGTAGGYQCYVRA